MDGRKMSILQAIVEDYVATREPVGSKALLERHDLGVSAATVRNDMAGLEEEGLIEQPHTSAGRVPTDKGYRAFVDMIDRVKPLSPPEKRAIQSLLDSSADLDDLLGRTVRLLASLTQQVAVVQYPSLSQAKVRHIELVPVGERFVLIVLITDTGRVDQQTIETAGPVDEPLVQVIRDRLNAIMIGHTVTGLTADLAAVVESLAPEHRTQALDLVRPLQALLDARVEERIVFAGTPNLARSSRDFPDSIHGVLEAIEEQIVLLRLLSEMSADPGELFVKIGREMPHASLTSASLVGTAYSTTRAPAGGSHLAILGPTRMDYATGMSVVRAVARYVSRYLG